VAVRETAGSALYGMVDVLSATGNVWQTLMRTTPEALPFRVKVVSTSREGFRCGYGIPVEPDASIHEIERAVRSSVAVLPPAIALVQKPLVVALQLVVQYHAIHLAALLAEALLGAEVGAIDLCVVR
jgi:hypothetical protein